MSSKKTPFVVVPYPHPIDPPMSVEEANERTLLDEWAGADNRSFVAFAEGERWSDKDEMEEVMFFLIYDHEDRSYTVFENWSSEWEEAVLIDGGARNDGRLLPPEQALARWIAGFMVMNEAAPGSHCLRYRLIEG